MAEMRRCIGSAKFGIEPHEAPIEDFPKQPSQKDGLGRMCRPHWNQYTTALRKTALGRKAAASDAAIEVAPTESEPTAKPEPIGTRVPRGRRQAEPVAEVAQDPVAE